MLDRAIESVTSFVGSNLAGPPPRGLPALPPVSRLSPRVTRILGMNPSAFTLQGTNTYLVGTGPRRWLIDTGEGRAEYVPLLERAMEEEGVVALEGVLLTHWHHDHVGGLPSVRAMLRRRAGADPDADPDAAEVRAHKRVRADKGEVAVDPAEPPPPLTSRAYVDIADGQVFDQVPGVTLVAAHTPGHSVDHVCFTLVEEGAVFAGDCVLNGNTATFEDLGEYSASLERMERQLEAAAAERRDASCAARRPADDGDNDVDVAPGRLYPSHGDVVIDGVAKLREYRKHRAWREEIFMDALRADWRERPEKGGATSWELCRAVYESQVSWLVLRTACAGITSQHLKKMVEEGRVRTEGGGGWFGKEPRYYPAAGEMERPRRGRE